MFCSQCAHSITPDDVYCPNCAKPVASFNFDPGQIPQVEYIFDEPTTIVRPPKTDTKVERSPLYKWLLGGSIVGIIVLFLVFGVGALFLLMFASSPQVLNHKPPSASNVDPADDVIRRAENARKQAERSLANAISNSQNSEIPKYQIVNSVFAVKAGQIAYFNFDSTSSARVTGGFRVYGGSNDIGAYIVDVTNYNLLVNGSAFQFVFGRPRIDRAKIDLTVPSGRWYIVFSNKHALFTDKQVAAEIYVQEQ